MAFFFRVNVFTFTSICKNKIYTYLYHFINKMISLIVAVSKNGVIGIDNKLPFNVPEDLKRFQQVTRNSVVVMGRKTAESIPAKFFPLKDRVNVVITRSKLPSKENLHYINLDEFDEFIKQFNQPIFIIGGSDIYRHFYKKCKKLFVTLVDVEIKGENLVYLPFEVKDDENIEWSMSSSGLRYKFIDYIKNDIQ